MRNKLHIKYMLIFKRAAKRKNVVDIAILLDNNQYIEYSVAFKQNVLTHFVAHRLINLFSSYLIDAKTDIMINPLIDVKHPICIYLDMLRANISFKFRVVTVDQIIGRIHYFFKSRSATKRKFTYVWKETLRREVCPWITKQVDYALQNKSPVMEHTMKTMRLGMFYMVVKNLFYYNKTKCMRNKARRLSTESSNVESSNVN